MKGVIVLALRDMMVERFGADKWKAVLNGAGLAAEPLILPISDVDDAQVFKLVESVCQVLNLTGRQAAEAFGDYWMMTYAAKMYPNLLASATNSRDFLLGLEELHVSLTKTMRNARPPHFDYEWVSPKTLAMRYRSDRGMVDYVVGLAQGVGHYYRETLQVRKLSADRVEVVFP